MPATPLRTAALGGLALLALGAGFVAGLAAPPLPALLGAAGGARARPGVRAVVVVTVDTLRADLIGCYGGEAGTPAIDALAARGVLYEDAVTPACFTAPAMCSLSTGEVPLVHGVRRWGDTSPGWKGPTLAEVFRAAGWDTAFFGAHGALEGLVPLSRGFATFVDARDAAAPDVVARGLEWLGERGGKPALLWLHFMEPHFPYRPAPESWPRDLSAEDAKWFATVPPNGVESMDAESPEGKRTGRIARMLYGGEVRTVDAGVAGLVRGLSGLGLEGSAVIAFVSDHGENLMDGRPRFGHVGSLGEPVMRVALVLAGPGVERGKRSRAVVASQRLSPTLAGLALPEPRAGEARPPGAALAADGAADAEILLDTGNPRGNVPFEGRGVRAGRWKLVLDAQGESVRLFDIPEGGGKETLADPATAPGAGTAAAALRPRIDVLVDAALRRQAVLLEPVESAGGLSPDAVARLRSLGYL